MLNILNVAQTGLKASQTQVENVMNNLANENTPGYKKRVVDVSEIEHADSRITGRGISIDDVSRATNIYMYQNLVKEESKLSDLSELNVMLNDIESIFFETDTAGLSADLNRYFQSIENLRTSPHSEIYKNDVQNNATILVDDLKRLYSDIEDREQTTLDNAKDNVDSINSILQEIGAISKQIQDTVGGTPNDLLDRRDNLELELAKYVDVEISREDSYELKVGGALAVRFDTNVHTLNLVENYTPQQDSYTAIDKTDGRTLFDGSGNYISSLLDIADPFATGNNIAEVQTLELSGDSTGKISFLGTDVAGSVAAQTAAQTATEIVNDKNNIMNNWNSLYPDKSISNIEIGVSSNELKITYDTLDGDVISLDNTSSNGINMTGSIETTKGSAESITYVLNNTHSITTTMGELVNGITVNENNIIQSLVYEINNNNDIGGTIHAYNGKYELAEDGAKILTSNPLHSKYSNPEIDHYLFIEAEVDGEEGAFVGEIIVNNNNDKTPALRNENISKDGIDDIHLEIFGKEINITAGSLNPMIENIKTDSGNNLFGDYKEQLDLFAKTLSDFSDAYIENTDQTYIYGTDAININSDEDKKISLNLFKGADVKSLEFNKSSINNLSQQDLDYLATLQWKEDIDFDGAGLNPTSFSQYYQTLRVGIADHRENVIFNQESQSAVTESMNNTYDKLTKVDKDEEMINLIKFQSAYEANAKVITVIDEMLSTLLNMKR